MRVRWAELGADITLNGSLTVAPYLALHQVSYHTGLSDLTQFADTQASNLLGAVLHSIGTPAPGSTLDNLMLALSDLGIVVNDSKGGYGVSSDAFAALQTAPAAYLSSKLSTALDAGIAGFSSVTGGPWSLSLPGCAARNSTRNRIMDGGDLDRKLGWPLGNEASLQFAASLLLPNFTPTLTATLQAGGLSLNFDGSHLTVAMPSYLSTPVQLIPPPSQAQLVAVLNDFLPRALFSGAATALLQSLVGSGITLPPLDSIFTSPSTFLKSANVLGDGTQLVSTKINTFLQWVNTKAGLSAGTGLQLPEGIQLVRAGHRFDRRSGAHDFTDANPHRWCGRPATFRKHRQPTPRNACGKLHCDRQRPAWRSNLRQRNLRHLWRIDDRTEPEHHDACRSHQPGAYDHHSALVQWV